VIVSNFTFQDILGILTGFALFPLVIVIPGYVTGWAFNLFEFRPRFLAARLAIALLLSITISPILCYLVASLISMKMAVLFIVGLALIFILLIIYDKGSFHWDNNWNIFVWIGTAWVVLVIFSLAQIQWKNQLLISIVSFDQTTRVSIIDAMTRTGVPPVNPGYYPGKAIPLTFLYYFWYILCSLVDVLGGRFVDARAALNASSVWAGLGLMAAVAFYLRLREVHFGGAGWRSIRNGLALLAVSGLDVMPIAILMLAAGQVVGSVDVWNTSIVSWVGSVLWVPHHVGALIAGVVAIMLAQSARYKRPLGRYTYLFFAGAGFASAFGMSVWVTFVFTVFWIIWIIALFLRREEHFFIFPLIFAGIMALFLSSSFLLGLFKAGSNASGSFPVVFEIRTLFQLESFVKEMHVFVRSLIMLLVLPINYLLELGFFFGVGIYWFKIKDGKTIFSNHFYLAEVLLLVVVILMGSCLRSTIGSNDLGWRAWLPGQFILLIWGVDVLNSFGFTSQPAVDSKELAKIRRMLFTFAAVGVLTSVVDIVLLRMAWPLMTGKEDSERYYSAHFAYDFLRDHVPAEAITQDNPFHGIDRPSGLYGTHQMVISARSLYGVSADDFNSLASEVSVLFLNDKEVDWHNSDRVCADHMIDIVIFDDTDPAWKNLPALKIQRAPLFENNHYAIFACGKYADH
jgi:hypothetical protein